MAENGDGRCGRPALAVVGEGGPEQGRDAGGSAVMRPLARAGGDGGDGNWDGRDRDGATGMGMATTGSVGKTSRRLGNRGRARAGTGTSAGGDGCGRVLPWQGPAEGEDGSGERPRTGTGTAENGDSGRGRP